MKNVAIAAVSGIAASASAQTASLLFEAVTVGGTAAVTSVAAGESFDLVVSATGTNGIYRFAIEVLAELSGDVGISYSNLQVTAGNGIPDAEIFPGFPDGRTQIDNPLGDPGFAPNFQEGTPPENFYQEGTDMLSVSQTADPFRDPAGVGISLTASATETGEAFPNNLSFDLNGNPELFRVTVTTSGTAGGTIDWNYAFASALEPVNTGALEFTNSRDTGVNVPTAYDQITFVSTSVAVTPTPGTMAILGLGGLAAARRRR